MELLLAAEAAEHSKTAFYVAGGVLVVWALVLSALGLSRPDFPRNDGAGRGVLALTLVLVAGAMATTVATA